MGIIDQFAALLEGGEDLAYQLGKTRERVREAFGPDFERDPKSGLVILAVWAGREVVRLKKRMQTAERAIVSRIERDERQTASEIKLALLRLETLHPCPACLVGVALNRERGRAHDDACFLDRALARAGMPDQASRDRERGRLAADELSITEEVER